MRPRRVATSDELDRAVRRYGPDGAARALRRYGLVAPIAGAAGWSQVQVRSGNTFTTPTTGVTLAFSSNVTAGNVLMCAAILFQSGSPATFSDNQSNTWASFGSSYNSSTNDTCAIGWAVASTGGVKPTVKATFTGSTSATMEIFIGEFVPPAGTVSADGILAHDSDGGSHGSQSTITWPPGNGVGSNDLLVNMFDSGGTFSAFGGSWVAMGATQSNKAAAYLLNAAGNSSPNAVQTTSTSWFSLVGAVQVTGGAAATTPQLMMMGVGS